MWTFYTDTKLFECSVVLRCYAEIPVDFTHENKSMELWSFISFSFICLYFPGDDFSKCCFSLFLSLCLCLAECAVVFECCLNMFVCLCSVELEKYSVSRQLEHT